MNRESWNQVGGRKTRIKSVAFRRSRRSPTKPIHLTLNPLKRNPAQQERSSGGFVLEQKSDKYAAICRRMEAKYSQLSTPFASLSFRHSKDSGPCTSTEPQPPLRRCSVSLPLWLKRVASKGWLLNYLDRTKRNKWRWIGPLMRYWPITGTHVYWYVALELPDTRLDVFLVFVISAERKSFPFLCFFFEAYWNFFLCFFEDYSQFILQFVKH